jgi:hypothetical protein
MIGRSLILPALLALTAACSPQPAHRAVVKAVTHAKLSAPLTRAIPVDRCGDHICISGCDLDGVNGGVVVNHDDSGYVWGKTGNKPPFQCVIQWRARACLPGAQRVTLARDAKDNFEDAAIDFIMARNDFRAQTDSALGQEDRHLAQRAVDRGEAELAAAKALGACP